MNASEIAPRDRFTRQRDLVPSDRLADVATTVIGVGAIGRQVALQLAAIGAPPGVYNATDNAVHTVREIARAMAAAAGRRPPFLRLRAGAVRRVVAAGERTAGLVGLRLLF